LTKGWLQVHFFKRGVHFAGLAVLGVDVEIENALDLLLPERAAFF
jgi:hypothetical protein